MDPVRITPLMHGVTTSWATSEPAKIQISARLSAANLQFLQNSSACDRLQVMGAPPGLCKGPPGVFSGSSRGPPGVFHKGQSCASSTTLGLSDIESEDAVSVISLQQCDDSCNEDFPCTLVMRNIPNKYTRELLLMLLDSHGFRGCYNLVYLPIDFATKVAVGYAFVSFSTRSDAERFKKSFDGFSDWVYTGSSKVCTVDWSNGADGLEAHIERFRNCPIMHPSVPDSFRPLLFVHGERVAFPPPTKIIRKPRASGSWHSNHAAAK